MDECKPLPDRPPAACAPTSAAAEADAAFNSDTDDDESTWGQRLTCVHFSAQRKRFLRDWGCV